MSEAADAICGGLEDLLAQIKALGKDGCALCGRPFGDRTVVDSVRAGRVHAECNISSDAWRRWMRAREEA